MPGLPGLSSVTLVLCAVWEDSASCFVLGPQDCFGNSASYMILSKFWDLRFYFCEKCLREFDMGCI